MFADAACFVAVAVKCRKLCMQMLYVMLTCTFGIGAGLLQILCVSVA